MQLMLPVPNLGRCIACEGPLIVKPDAGHIEPALTCPAAACSRVGICLTCSALVEWFQRVNEELDCD